jgi:hypothetical protein
MDEELDLLKQNYKMLFRNRMDGGLRLVPIQLGHMESIKETKRDENR